MAFTAKKFGQKLQELRQSFDEAIEALASATGIPPTKLQSFEEGSLEPTGDEVLILSDYYHHDFAWFIDDEAGNPDNNMKTLFRVASDRLSTNDRHAISEFLHLCKSQALLEHLLQTPRPIDKFKFEPQGSYIVGQGQQCAKALRSQYGLQHNAIIPDIFGWLRQQGIRVFRRALQNSPISGLFIEHAEAGRCVLINSREDLYRQRFSAAHEVAHALMDQSKNYNISDAGDQFSEDFMEIRANAFASSFLMPAELLRSMGTPDQWKNPDKLKDTASKLWVSVPALLSALKQAKIIDEATRTSLRDMKLRVPDKQDPELPSSLSPNQRVRMQHLLAVGLHGQYVDQCFEAHRRELISLGKLAEVLMVDTGEIADIAKLFGITINNA